MFRIPGWEWMNFHSLSHQWCSWVKRVTLVAGSVSVRPHVKHMLGYIPLKGKYSLRRGGCWAKDLSKRNAINIWASTVHVCGLLPNVFNGAKSFSLYCRILHTYRSPLHHGIDQNFDLPCYHTVAQCNLQVSKTPLSAHLLMLPFFYAHFSKDFVKSFMINGSVNGNGCFLSRCWYSSI